MDKLIFSSAEKSNCQSCYGDVGSLYEDKVKKHSKNQLDISDSDIQSFKKCFPSNKDVNIENDIFSKQIGYEHSIFSLPTQDSLYTSRQNILEKDKKGFCGISEKAFFLENREHLINFSSSNDFSTDYKANNSKNNVFDCLNLNGSSQNLTKLSFDLSSFSIDDCKKKNFKLGANEYLKNKAYRVNLAKLPTIEEIKWAVQNSKIEINFTFYELFRKLNENNENNVQNIINECIKHIFCQNITRVVKYFLDGQVEIDKTVMEYLMLDTYGIDPTELETATGFSFSDIIEWGIKYDYFLRLDNLKVLLKNEKNDCEKKVCERKDYNLLCDENSDEIEEGKKEICISTSGYSFSNESTGKLIILYVLYMGLPRKVYSTVEFKRNVFEFCGESIDENFCKRYFNSSCMEDVCKEYFGNIIEMKTENNTSFFILNENETKLWEIFCANVEKYVAITGKKVDLLTIKNIPRKTNIIKNISGIWIPNDFKFNDLF